LILAAASEYFDIMFYGGFRESHVVDIPLHGVDAATFEKVLRYVYKGEVTIADDNVYDLLCASEMLGLCFIEKCCVRYLRERRVPVDCALEIFMYAGRTQKNTLLPAASRCILEHLDYFSKNNEFLGLALDDLNLWILNCPPLSSKQENLMLDAICRWVSRLNCSSEEKRSSFMQLMQTISFRHISAERISEYLDNNIIDCDEGCDGCALDIVDSKNEPSELIYAFINTHVNNDESGEDLQSNLFTVQIRNEDVEWDHGHIMKPYIDNMSTVVCEDRLYCLKWQKGEKYFSVCSSVDSSANSQLLTSPRFNSQRYSNDVRLRSDKKSIYLFDYLDRNEELLVYSPGRRADTC
jgi:hypothetical protein